MSRSRKKVKHPGKDWWGKRPFAGTGVSNNAGVMKKWKRFLHKVERQQAKKVSGDPPQSWSF
jgi:hypothetical protein